MESGSRRGMLIVFLVVVIDLLGFGIVLPLLPRYGDRLHASDLVIGLLTGVFSAMQFLFSPWWGKLSDRVGRRPVLLVGLGGSVVFYALFGYASAIECLTLLFVARIGAGIFGATISSAQAFIADSTTVEKRTPAMALIGAAFGIGFTFGPLLGALALIYASGPTLSPMPGILAAGLSGIAFILAVFLLPESLHPASRAAGHRRLDADSLRVTFLTPTVPTLILAFFAATFAFAQFETTLSPVTDRVFKLPDKQTFFVFFYVGLTFALAQGLIVRRMAKTVADQSLAFWGVALMILGIGLGLAALQVRSLTMLIVVLPVLILGYAMMTPSLQSMVSKATPADRQGAVLGINASASSLARILGQTLGIVWLGAHITLPYLISAGLMALVLLLLARLPAVSVPSTTASAEPSPPPAEA